MAEDYRYSDDGDHQLWTDAHQGSSYSRVNKLHRFFIGSHDVYPAVGGDSFRLDSQVGLASLPVGEQLLSLVSVGTARVSTVGVIEDEIEGCGRYFFMRYEGIGGSMTPTKLMVYDSPYTSELLPTSTLISWDPIVSLPPYVEQGMRVINLGEAANRTFLFYLVPGSVSTKVNVVSLPDSGAPASTASPKEVIDLSFVVRDRIYVVQDTASRVFIYVGDTEKSPTQQTLMIHYDVDSEAVIGSLVVKDGSTPFPRSYAVARGRTQHAETPVHMVLEPQSSWVEGAGRSIDDFPSIDNEHSPLFRQSTGNAWEMVSMEQNGTVVKDSVTFQGSDIKPWMSGAEADAQGGQVRVAAVPRYLIRMSPPPEAYAALQSTPTVDNCDVYVVHTAAMIRYRGIREDAAFVYRLGTGSNILLRNTFGNHRGIANTFEGNPPDLDTVNRRDTTLLVPGTILIEDSQTTQSDKFQPYRTVGTLAVRLDSWGLDDDSSFHGFPHTGLDGSTTLVPTDWDPSTDAIHGVQGDVFDENLSVIVGWFVNGFLPP